MAPLLHVEDYRASRDGSLRGARLAPVPGANFPNCLSTQCSNHHVAIGRGRSRAHQLHLFPFRAKTCTGAPILRGRRALLLDQDQPAGFIYVAATSDSMADRTGSKR
ncbi:hypothetical protein NPIL_82831 [Nephila pilipes]|uniref:Uncharacterized protein n=1 Tax=Nephila pilipes TaxID=299642 RepID=A0A8X6PDI7_NEPPI|nr:hypothetical protein NPIL_82831 [Nephila pilipes]